MASAMRSGHLFIISGPSGAGKGTLVREVARRMPDMWVSVSATTRTPRPGERDGVDYFFLTPAEFDGRVRSGAFQVRKRMDRSRLIFVKAPTTEDLEKRIRNRGAETDEQIRTRLETARSEMELEGSYDHVVINDDVPHAVDDLIAYISSVSEPPEDKDV
jgi:guanylate kinase